MTGYYKDRKAPKFCRKTLKKFIYGVICFVFRTYIRQKKKKKKKNSAFRYSFSFCSLTQLLPHSRDLIQEYTFNYIDVPKNAGLVSRRKPLTFTVSNYLNNSFKLIVISLNAI